MNKKLPLPFRGNRIYPLLFAILLIILHLQVFSQDAKNVLTGKIKDNNAPAQDKTVRLTVHPNQISGKIDRNIYMASFWSIFIILLMEDYGVK